MTHPAFGVSLAVVATHPAFGARLPQGLVLRLLPVFGLSREGFAAPLHPAFGRR